MTRLFGTDGMRGEAGRFPLDAETVRLVGRSLARHLSSKNETRTPRILTGRDTRESGPWIERALILGALEGGAICESAGVITTPAVAYLAGLTASDAGVVVSASHNPYEDNGIKLFARSGRKLDEATERLIESDLKNRSQQIRTLANEPTHADATERTQIATNPVNATILQAKYKEHLLTDVAGALDLNSIKIVVDCANGAASDIAPGIFKNLGANVIQINDSPNGRNINLDCGSLHIDGVQRKVIETGADLGVAFDGDADRALFVDAGGRFVDGDATLWVMAKQLRAKGELTKDIVVATVMSNIGLEVAFRSIGIEFLRTDVGDKYVLDKLLETGASIGGEQSGHIIFPQLSLAGDGIVTTLLLLCAMRESKADLASLTAGFTRFPQVLVNVRVREKLPFNDVPSIAQVAQTVEAELGDQGRLLLRYSGTEPLARVMIEGEHQNVIEQQANVIAAAIKEAIGEL